MTQKENRKRKGKRKETVRGQIAASAHFHCLPAHVHDDLAEATKYTRANLPASCAQSNSLVQTMTARVPAESQYNKKQEKRKRSQCGREKNATSARVPSHHQHPRLDRLVHATVAWMRSLSRFAPTHLPYSASSRGSHSQLLSPLPISNLSRLKPAYCMFLKRVEKSLVKLESMPQIGVSRIPLKGKLKSRRNKVGGREVANRDKFKRETPRLQTMLCQYRPLEERKWFKR